MFAYCSNRIICESRVCIYWWKCTVKSSVFASKKSWGFLKNNVFFSGHKFMFHKILYWYRFLAYCHMLSETFKLMMILRYNFQTNTLISITNMQGFWIMILYKCHQRQVYVHNDYTNMYSNLKQMRKSLIL